MIDQEQINRSIKSMELAITSCLSTPSNKLFQINSAIDNDMIHKLKTYLTTVDSSKWQYFQNNNLRKVINWDADTVIEELHDVFNGITALISQQFSTGSINFLGSQLWKDTNNYHMSYHIDNPVIDIALQLYLFDAPKECGTVFKINNQEYLVPFEHNTGYVYKNQVSEGIPHKVEVNITPDANRYSLYAIWSRSEKIKEE
jgi:hypothetical protein